MTSAGLPTPTPAAIRGLGPLSWAAPPCPCWWYAKSSREASTTAASVSATAPAIELPQRCATSNGFDVTNPVDGTRYQVRRTGITITSPDGQVYPEPMIEYWAS